MFRDYQFGLGNTVSLTGAFKGEIFKILARGEEHYMGDLAFYGGLDNPLNHIVLSYPYKFMSGYLYFPKRKNIKDHIKL